MNRRGILAVGTVAFAALCGLTIAFGGARTIQNDLTAKTRNLLAANGVDGDVHFSGRDGELRTAAGLPAGVLAQLQHMHRRDFDIRHFTVIEADTAGGPTTTSVSPISPSTTTPTSTGASDTAPTTASTVTTADTAATPTTTADSVSSVPATTVASPTTSEAGATTTTAPATGSSAPAPGGVSVAASLTNGRIALTGTVVSTIEQLALESGAQRAVGADHVDSRLNVVAGDAATSDPQVQGLERVLERFGADLTPATASVGGGVLEVSGTATSFEAAARLQAALDTAAGVGLRVHDTVARPPLQIAAIQFARDSADISPTAVPVLDQVVAALTAMPNARVEVGGHTDNAGNAAANLILSQRRADAVVAYLVARGIAAGRLTAVGYGDTRPVADNSTAAGRDRNRRIEFTVTGA